MAAIIQAEANRKRSEKAKEQHAVSTPRHGETMVVVPEEQVPNEAERAPGRAARAEDAGVSPSTADVAGKDAARDSGPGGV